MEQTASWGTDYKEEKMSLQGTIDTFEIPDVLRLLASTKKTGQLSISGNRGVGSVWVKGGDVIFAEASAAPWATSSAEVVFELLRYSTGEFVFHTDAPMPEEDRKPEKVDPVLNSASSMLKEWETIEKVVPSLAAPLKLAPKLPEASVEINEASWKMIVGIGSGSTVGDLGNSLEQSEIVISRNIKQLIEAKLVDIEYAAPVLPSGVPVTVDPIASPSVTYHTGSPYMDSEPVETPYAAEEPTVVTEDDIVLQSVEESTEVYVEETHEHEAPQGPYDYSAQQGEDYSEEMIDLDDPVQVARAIEGMSPEVARMAAVATRAATAEERESILGEIQEIIDPIDFAVVQRFVYSLIV
jgi:hypothetical protein